MSQESASFSGSRENEFLSLADAAREFGVRQDYLRLLIFKKKLKAVKLGRNWVTTRAWLAEQKQLQKTLADDSAYLALPTAAKEFGLSHEYLRYLIFKGKLRAVKLGRNWVTTRAWLREQRDSTKTSAVPEPAVVLRPERRIVAGTLVNFSFTEQLISRGFLSRVRGVFSSARLSDVLKNIRSRFPNAPLHFIRAVALSSIALAIVVTVITAYRLPPAVERASEIAKSFIANVSIPRPEEIPQLALSAAKDALASIQSAVPQFLNSFANAFTLFVARIPNEVARLLHLGAPPAIVSNPPVSPLPSPVTRPSAPSVPTRAVTRVHEIIETREVVKPADISAFQKQLDGLNAGLRSTVNKLVSDVAALYEGPETKTSLVRTFAPSLRTNLFSQITVDSGLTVSSGDIIVSAGNLSVTGNGSFSGDLSVHGNFGASSISTPSFTVSGSGTTTFSGGISSLGIDSSRGLRISTGDAIFAGGANIAGQLLAGLNTGIGTGTPGASLAVKGEGLFAGRLAASTFVSTSTTDANIFPFASTTAIGISNLLTVSGTGTSTFSGGLTVGANNGFVINAQPQANSFYLAGNGNTGHGTSSPGALLAVSGEGLFGGTLRAPSLVATSSIQLSGQAAASGSNCLQIDTTGNITKTGSGCAVGTVTGTGGISMLSYWTSVGNIAATSSPTASIFTATSTTLASTFPIASSTSFSVADRLTVSGTGTSTFAGAVTPLALSTTNSATIGNLLSVSGTGTSTFTGAVTNLNEFITNGLTIGNLLTISGTGTSTFSGSTDTTGMGKFGSINVTGSAQFGGTPNFTGSGTTTFSGGISSLGIDSSRGLRVSSGDAIFAGGANIAGQLLAGLNTGIGTGTPGAAFAVKGEGLFEGRVTASNFVATSTALVNTFTVASTTSLTVGDRIQVNGAGTSTFSGALTVGANGGLAVTNAAPANTLFVGSGGNVGIGTAGPSSILHVKGSGNNAGGGIIVDTGITDKGVFQTLNVGNELLSFFGSNLYADANLATQRFNTANLGWAFVLDNRASQDLFKLERVSAAGAVTRPVIIKGDGSFAFGNLTTPPAFTGGKFVMDSTGNVGIATATPGALFSVHGPALFGNGTTTALSGLITPSIAATSSLGFYATSAAAPRMYIDPSGNVGIGTANPNELLQVQGGFLSSYHASSANTAGYPIRFYTDGGATKNTIGELGIVQNGNNVRKGRLYVGLANGGAPGDSGFTVLETGNVGVNVPNPINKFDVNGAAAFGTYGGNNTAPSNGLIVSGNVGIATTTPGALFSVHGPELINGTSTIIGGVLTPSISATSSLGFYTAGAAAPRMVIDPSGNVGIGTAVPGEKLEVNGNIKLPSNTSNYLTWGGCQPKLINDANAALRIWDNQCATAAAITLNNGAQIYTGQITAGANADVFVFNNAPGAVASNRYNIRVEEAGSTVAGILSGGGAYFAGNVGIGTTTPGTSLAVHNGSADIGGVLTAENGLKTGWFIATSTTVASTFSVASTTSLTVLDRLQVNGTGTSTFSGALTVGANGGFAVTNNTPANTLFVGSGGHVGIGTAMPSAVLNVVNTISSVVGQFESPGTPALRIKRTDSTTASGRLSFVGSDDTVNFEIATNNLVGAGIEFNNNTRNFMFINASGNVGIATATPGALFSVHGPELINGTSTIIGGVLTPSISATSSLGFYTAGAAAPRMYVNPSGNVGIGTTNPTQKFDIFGGSAHTYGVVRSTQSASDASWSVSDGTNTWYTGLLTSTGQGSAGDYVFYKGGVVPLIIKSGGNVGIGTTVPGRKLHIVGTAGFPVANPATDQGAFRIAAGTNSTLEFGNSDVSTGGTYPNWIQSRDVNVSAVYYSLLLNPLGGNVGIGTTTPGTSLAVHNGSADIGGVLTAENGLKTGWFIATSTTVASTFNVASTTSLTVLDRLQVNGTGTSTFSGALTVGANGGLAVTSAAPANTLYVGSGGNVGIGTAGPNQLLTIAPPGNQRAIVGLVSTSGNGSQIFMGDNGIYAGAIGWNQTVSKTMQFAVSSGVDLTNDGNFANNIRLSILSSGNVGIGTTSPGSLLAVKGPFLTNSTSTIEGAGLITQSLFSTSSLTFYTNTNNTPRVKIDESGNVGIGTAVPGATLDVRSSGQYVIPLSLTSGSNPQVNILSFSVPSGNYSGGINTSGQYFVSSASPNNQTYYGEGVIRGSGYRGALDIIMDDQGGGFTQNLTLAPGRTTAATGNVYVVGTTNGGVYLNWGGTGSASGVPNAGYRGNTGLFVRGSDGNVGIGTTSPGSLLAVKGPFLTNSTSTIEGAGLITQSLFSTSSLTFYTNTNNTPRMKIDESGNVGIGTVNPDALLSVQTSGQNAVLNLYGVLNATKDYGAIQVSNTGSLTNPSARPLILQPNAGKVGIGSITPNGLLEINSGLSDFLKLRIHTESALVGDYAGIAFGADTNNEFMKSSITHIRQTSNGGGDLAFFVSGSSAASNVASSDEKMRIQGLTGNVGIGTTSPGALLSVKGPFLANSTSTIEGAGLVAQALFSTSSLTFYTNTNNTPRVKIDESGNVGIGTMSPVAKLDVTQLTVGVPALRVSGDDGNGTAGTRPRQIFITGITNANLKAEIGFDTTSKILVIGALEENVAWKNIVFANNGGNVGIGTTNPGAQLDLSTDSARKLTTTTWSTGSDIRIKTNVQSISDALGIISRVRPVKFHYTPEFLAAHPSVKDTDYYNFIAQEYQQVFPNSVSTSTDGLLYLNSSNMIPYAIAGIREAVLALDAASSTDATIEAGNIVAPDATATGNIKKSHIGDTAVLGIVSSPQLSVAASGRVPVKVSTEGGPIAIGDRIAVSSLAGIGMKATTSGMTVGIALEDFDGSTATTTALTSESATTTNGIAETTVVKTGTILVFVNLGYEKLDEGTHGLALGTSGVWSVDPATGKLKSSVVAGLDLQGQDLINVRSILSAGGTWSIDENGMLVAAKIKTQELEVGTDAMPSGITLYDKVTHLPSCIILASGTLSVTAGQCANAVTGAGTGVSSGQTSGSATPSGDSAGSGATSSPPSQPPPNAGSVVTPADTTIQTSTSTPPADISAPILGQSQQSTVSASTPTTDRLPPVLPPDTSVPTPALTPAGAQTVSSGGM